MISYEIVHFNGVMGCDNVLYVRDLIMARSDVSLFIGYSKGLYPGQSDLAFPEV